MNLFALQATLDTDTVTNIICNELVDAFAEADSNTVKWTLVDAITVVLFHNRSSDAPTELLFRDGIRKAVVSQLFQN